MSNYSSGWYVVYTKPKHEKKVAARLAGAGIDHFLPMARKLRTWHDRKKYVDVPLFPSYVFVFLSGKMDYYTGMDTDGVWYFVRYGTEIARVPDKVISDLQMLSSGNNELEVTSEGIQPGRQLAITQGSLCGLSCEVVEFKGKKGFLVRVQLLQRNVLVSLPSEYLIATLA